MNFKRGRSHAASFLGMSLLCILFSPFGPGVLLGIYMMALFAFAPIVFFVFSWGGSGKAIWRPAGRSASGKVKSVVCGGILGGGAGFGLFAVIYAIENYVFESHLPELQELIFVGVIGVIMGGSIGLVTTAIEVYVGSE